MVKLLLSSLLLLITFVSPVRINASTVILPGSNINKETQNRYAYSKIPVDILLKLTPGQISKLKGKKLSLSEKLGLIVLKHRLKRLSSHQYKERDKGKTAFILGLTGLIFLVIPFLNLASIPLAILAIIIGSKAKKQYPRNKMARTGVTLGIVTLAILLVIGTIVAIVVSVGPWRF